MKTELVTPKFIKNISKRTWLDDIRYYGFYIWYNWLYDRPLKIKSFIQRGFRGWSNEDTWDFDIYLAKVITEGIKHLKKVHHGCPSDIYEKYRINNKLTQKQKDKLAKKEWKTILDIIIRGFELVPELFEMKVLKNKKLSEGYMYELERAFDYFKKFYFNLWD